MNQVRVLVRQIGGLGTAVLLAAGLLGSVLGSLGAAETAVSVVDGSKSGSVSVAHPGETVSYTIVISNSTASATHTTMQDRVPEALILFSETVTASDGDYALQDQTITWSGALSPEQAVTVTFAAALSRQVTTGDLISNTAVISSGGMAFSRTAVLEVLTHTIYLPLIRTTPPVLQMDPITPTCAGSNSWTVAWSDGGPFVDAYELHQSQSPDFADPTTFLLTETSRLMQPPLSPEQLYHYRVRANGHWGNGAWSNARRIIGNFFDNFSDANSGWGAQESDRVRFRYEDGAYTILSKEAGDYRRGAPSYSLQNYTVEADVRWDTVVTDGFYGLFFGLNQEMSEYYLFLIQTDAQAYRLIRRNEGGTFTSLIPPTTSSAINIGGATNHLSARRNGTAISLSVNGVPLDTVEDNAISGLTGAGIAMSPNPANPVAKASFDNFAIHGCRLPEEGETGFLRPFSASDHPIPGDFAPFLWQNMPLSD